LSWVSTIFVFISIQSAKLPAEQQKRARRIGLLLALVMRVALLFSIKWVMGLTAPLVNFAEWFNITNERVAQYLVLSGRDLI